MFVVGDDVLDAETGEMTANLGRITPEIHPSNGVCRAIFQQRIGRIDKRQPAGAVVLQAQGQANNTETVARADYQDMFRPQGPCQAVIDKTKSQVEIGGGFAVPQGFGVFEYSSDHLGVETEGRKSGRGCLAVV